MLTVLVVTSLTDYESHSKFDKLKKPHLLMVISDEHESKWKMKNTKQTDKIISLNLSENSKQQKIHVPT